MRFGTTRSCNAAGREVRRFSTSEALNLKPQTLSYESEYAQEESLPKAFKNLWDFRGIRHAAGSGANFENQFREESDCGEGLGVYPKGPKDTVIRYSGFGRVVM